MAFWQRGIQEQQAKRQIKPQIWMEGRKNKARGPSQGCPRAVMAGAGAPGDELLGLQQLAAHLNVIWGGPMWQGHHPGARWLTGARPKWLLGPYRTCPLLVSPRGLHQLCVSLPSAARSAPCHKLSSQTLNPLSGWERGADHLGGISGYIERGK